MGATPLKILLVDDDEKLLKSMVERSRLRGFEPFAATTGAQALEIARDTEIRIAVVDLRLPDMDGLVVITKLKEIHPDLGTILLTAHGDERLKEASEALNSAYFDKSDMDGFWKFLEESPFKAATVLIVDDDEALLETLARRLGLKGHVPLTATTGAQALELAAKHTIQVAIIDLRLPDMDGLVVITKLKGIQPGIKTVLLTAFGDEKLKAATEALNSAYFDKDDMPGFWGFLRKSLRRFETMMAAAAMATGGDPDTARDILEPPDMEKKEEEEEEEEEGEDGEKS